MTTRRRLVLSAVALVNAAGPLAVVAMRDRLPNRLATHWNIRGRPNGSMSYAAFTAVIGFGALVAVVCLVWSVRSAQRPRSRASALFGVLLATLTSIDGFVTVAANLDRSSAHTARSLPLWAELVTLAVAAAATALTARALPPRIDDRHGHAAVTPLELGPSERALWVQSASNRWLLVPLAAAAVAGIVLAVIPATMTLGLVMLAIAFVSSFLATIRVTADRQGLMVAYGPLHFPRTHIHRRQIASADAIDINPWQWGGWGYRGSLRVMHRAAVVLRKGPGLRVDLRDGSVFAVTVPDAATAAALLNRLAAEDAVTGDRPA